MNPHEIPSLEIFVNRLPIQVRFSDVDVVGHVNNIVYFAYYDTGKAAFMAELLHRKVSWKEVDTVVANVDCAFISPIFWGEKIEVLTTCSGIHDKSFRLLQMLRNSESGEVKSICETVMVSFDPNTQTAAPLNPEWRQKLEAILQKRDIHN
ncbi:MAG: acyl-CoA thioesterase [Muribaculaceae bacterium]|nr:acyl-CoA thioesterase [Muribaculaceae bacterium]